ncbi:hypothetical protein [Nocardia barduliensis]|uniref:hypothetical protein n=1 Tax=Nocardia barduliensis TaxID=2736643 RepID=UPI00157235FF|nr:hypothetical protein [Nocardia barduliensis]
MTYDFAAWEGEPPADDAAASEECGRLYRHYIEGDDLPPAERMRSFVADLNARWPDLDDLDEDSVDDSPWGDSPLIENASGPYIYFTTMYSKAAEVAAYAAERAKAHGLVFFDVNQDRLLT